MQAQRIWTVTDEWVQVAERVHGLATEDATDWPDAATLAGEERAPLVVTTGYGDVHAGDVLIPEPAGDWQVWRPVESPARALGRRGGQAKSPAKTAAVRANGRHPYRHSGTFSLRLVRGGRGRTTLAVVDAAGAVVGQYRLTPGQERREMGMWRRTISAHLDKPGATLGNYPW